MDTVIAPSSGADDDATAQQQQDGALRIAASVPSTDFVAVEFPGYVRNAGRATRMLGGEEGIAAALSARPASSAGPAAQQQQGGSFLKLSFCPDDPTVHPLIGDQHAARGLVLRIARKRKGATKAAAAGGAGGPGAAEGEAAAESGGQGGGSAMEIDAEPSEQQQQRQGEGEGKAAGSGTAAAAAAPERGDAQGDAELQDEPKLSFQVVAQVLSSYRFTRLADYHFLPLDPSRGTRYRPPPHTPTAGPHSEPDALPAVPVAPENQPETAEPSAVPEAMLVLPPMFAPDEPLDYAFKQYKYSAAGRGEGRRRMVEWWLESGLAKGQKQRVGMLWCCGRVNEPAKSGKGCVEQKNMRDQTCCHTQPPVLLLLSTSQLCSRLLQ